MRVYREMGQDPMKLICDEAVESSFEHRRRDASLSVTFQGLCDRIVLFYSTIGQLDKRRCTIVTWWTTYTYKQNVLGIPPLCVQLGSEIPCPSLCYQIAIAWLYLSQRVSKLLLDMHASSSRPYCGLPLGEPVVKREPIKDKRKKECSL